MPVNPYGRPIDWVKLAHLDSLGDTITVPTTRPGLLAVACIVEYYEATRYINCIMCRKSGKLDFERVGKYSGIVELVKVDTPNAPGCSPDWLRVTANDTKSIMCVVAYYTTSSSSDIQAFILFEGGSLEIDDCVINWRPHVPNEVVPLELIASTAFLSGISVANGTLPTGSGENIADAMRSHSPNIAPLGDVKFSQPSQDQCQSVQPSEPTQRHASTEDPDDELNALEQASMPVKRRKLPDSRFGFLSSGDSIPTSPAPHNEGFMVHRKSFQIKSGMDMALPTNMMYRGLMQHSQSKPQSYQYKQQFDHQSCRNLQRDFNASKPNGFMTPFPTDNQRFRESSSDFSGVYTARYSNYTTANTAMDLHSGNMTGRRRTADGLGRAPTTQAYNRINEGPGNQALIGTSPLGYNRNLNMFVTRTAGIPHGSKPPSTISPVSTDEQICPEGWNTIPGNSQPNLRTLRPKPVQRYQDVVFLTPYEEPPPSYEEERKGKKGNKS
ncbi:hypothetical protein HYALB_00004862 [Hymenoscyphus albidus]|uniref:Uncharacterized protein n=1 Tax=Hymenoscyphus albidus TaxID=595503 RepID=A0A9N9LVI9_9HELO|nr:hypothetical protein HYALB_00004862 [Hymenoscyphus albidus]